MLKIGTVKWNGKCGKHPMFDPDADGPGAVKGGCTRCAELVAIHESHQRTLQLMRAFGPGSGMRRRRTNLPEDRQQGLFDTSA